MTDPAQTQAATFQQLERLIAQADRLQLDALQRPEIDAEDYAAVVAHYDGWYAACLAILPPDLRHRFQDAYSAAPLQPSLETYLAHAREPNPNPRPAERSAAWSPWKYPFNYSVHLLLHEQQSVLVAFRERLLDGVSAVSRELKDLVATIFAGRQHSVFTIDGLFTQAGAQRGWWVKPVAMTGKKRDRVRGWFAGITIHAPDRERAIVAAVCRAILDNELASQATATRLAALLETLAPAEPPAPLPPAAQLYLAPERLEALRQISSPQFDLARLIRLCEELNLAMNQKMFFAAAMLTRAIIDHVPPIFGATSFKEMVAASRTAAFKEPMQRLDIAVRKIADLHLQPHIRSKELLLTFQQVNLGTLLDVLLSEAARVLTDRG